MSPKNSFFFFLLAFISLRLLIVMQTCPLPVRRGLLVLGDVGGGEETMQGLDGGGPRSPPVPLKPSMTRTLEEKDFSSEVRAVAGACMASVDFMLGGGKRDETSAAVAKLRPMVLEASAEFQAKALGTPRCPVASQGGAAGSRIARGKHFFDTVKYVEFWTLKSVIEGFPWFYSWITLWWSVD